MSTRPPPPDIDLCEKFPFLKQPLVVLRSFFRELGINYETKITSLNPPSDQLGTKIDQIRPLLHDLLSSTKNLTRESAFVHYRELDTIIENTLTLLPLLQELLPTNLAKFYRESHRLLKYYWGIRFFIVRSELESDPDYRENQIPLFSLSDAVFEFMQTLQAGPQPIEILCDVDLEVRLDRRLSFLLSRSPDHIELSALGKKLLEVHAVSEFYYYYLYEFEEDILGSSS